MIILSHEMLMMIRLVEPESEAQGEGLGQDGRYVDPFMTLSQKATNL